MRALSLHAFPGVTPYSEDLVTGLRDAVGAHPGDVPLVLTVWLSSGVSRRLLFGPTHAVEPSLDLEMRLRDLGLDLGPDTEVRPWRS